MSTRAVACPDCGFPVAEEVAATLALQAAEREASSRVAVGEVDCPPCIARGFRMVTSEDTGSQLFEWCSRCERSGRSPLVRSDAGYFAVSFEYLAAFTSGASADDRHVTALGAHAPTAFRYPQAGPRVASSGDGVAPPHAPRAVGENCDAENKPT